jgi:hypothetical protein
MEKMLSLKNAGSEATGSKPITGLTLLWASNQFRGNFNHWLSLTKRSRTDKILRYIKEWDR